MSELVDITYKTAYAGKQKIELVSFPVESPDVRLLSYTFPHKGQIWPIGHAKPLRFPILTENPDRVEDIIDTFRKHKVTYYMKNGEPYAAHCVIRGMLHAAHCVIRGMLLVVATEYICMAYKYTHSVVEEEQVKDALSAAAWLEHTYVAVL